MSLLPYLGKKGKIIKWQVQIDGWAVELKMFSFALHPLFSHELCIIVNAVQIRVIPFDWKMGEKKHTLLCVLSTNIFPNIFFSAEKKIKEKQTFFAICDYTPDFLCIQTEIQMCE